MPFDSTDAMTTQAGVTAREACVTASDVNVTASEVYVTASAAWQSRLYKAPTAAPARVDRHAALAMTDWGLAGTAKECITASEACVTVSQACVTASEAWQSRLYEAPTAAPARVDRHAALAMTGWGLAMTGWGLAMTDWGLGMTCHGLTP